MATSWNNTGASYQMNSLRHGGTAVAPDDDDTGEYVNPTIFNQFEEQMLAATSSLPSGGVNTSARANNNVSGGGSAGNTNQRTAGIRGGDRAQKTTEIDDSNSLGVNSRSMALIPVFNLLLQLLGVGVAIASVFFFCKYIKMVLPPGFDILNYAMVMFYAMAGFTALLALISYLFCTLGKTINHVRARFNRHPNCTCLVFKFLMAICMLTVMFWIFFVIFQSITTLLVWNADLESERTPLGGSISSSSSTNSTINLDKKLGQLIIKWMRAAKLLPENRKGEEIAYIPLTKENLITVNYNLRLLGVMSCSATALIIIGLIHMQVCLAFYYMHVKIQCKN